MRILFIHQAFPGQFRYIATALAQVPGNQVVFLTATETGEIPGVKKVIYRSRSSGREGIHHYLRSVQDAVLAGQAAFRQAAELKKQGFVPDVIFGHSGRGSTLYMKDLFPNSRLTGYFEWFYQSHGSSFGFDPDAPVTADNAAEIRTKNCPILMDLVSCDAGISPTHWQHSRFPREFSAKIAVIHDGIHTDYFSPSSGSGLVLPRIGLDLPAGCEIVTYVATGMEPLRGFPQFMAAASLLQRRRPGCHVVVVGEDRVEYGNALKEGETYRTKMLAKYEFDLSRLHFAGRLSLEEYRRVLWASSVHVYLTYPFILSWSMLEAMSCGCAVVGSGTPPVAEAIEDNVNGLLTDFFDSGRLADKVETVLDDSSLRQRLGAQARQTILDRYDLRKMLPQQIRLLQTGGAGNLDVGGR